MFFEQRQAGDIPDIWISFADSSGFLGAVVVPGSDPDDNISSAAALASVRSAGLDPGGQALVALIPPSGQFPYMQLLSHEDIKMYDEQASCLKDLSDEDRFRVREETAIVSDRERY